MASVDVIFVAIVILGIIYMYINSRQYLVRDGFTGTVSWPGGSDSSVTGIQTQSGVVSPPPFSVTGPASGSGYTW